MARNTFLKLGYVGSQAHHLLVLTSADPGNAALCLSVSQQSQVAPGSPSAGRSPKAEPSPRRTGAPCKSAGRSTHRLTASPIRRPLGFPTTTRFEATVRHTSATMEVMAAYTYGKSLDDSSSLSEPVYPMGAAMSKAISAFDLRHNFVASYRYTLPFERLTGKQNRLTTGWSITGITRFPPDCR